MQDVWVRSAEEKVKKYSESEVEEAFERAKATRGDNIATARLLIEAARREGEGVDVDAMNQRVGELVRSQDEVIWMRMPYPTERTFAGQDVSRLVERPVEPKRIELYKRLNQEGREAARFARSLAESVQAMVSGQSDKQKVWEFVHQGIGIEDEDQEKYALESRGLIEGARIVQAITGVENFTRWTQIDDTRQGEAVPSWPLRGEKATETDLGLGCKLVIRRDEKGPSGESHYTAEVVSNS